MQLSLRLAAISRNGDSGGNRLVDVGCDHGYLPVYLVLNKRIPSAIAHGCEKRTRCFGQRSMCSRYRGLQIT